MSTLAQNNHAARMIAEPRRKRGSQAWLVILILALVSMAAVGYLLVALRSVREALASSQSETSAARAKAGMAERRAQDAESQRNKEHSGLTQELVSVKQQLAVTANKAKEADQLAERLTKAVASSNGEVTRDGDKLTLELVDKVLFQSGQAELTPSGVKVLKDVGKILQEYPDKQVWVQGHTDDLPIATPEFPSNWELSTTRAVHVVHFLEDIAGVSPQRLAAVGFSKFRPVSKKRAKNRRIEIVLFPQKVTLKK